MSVIYLKYQDKRKESENFGKWYGRSVMIDTISTKQLAKEIAHATTVTYADVLAVLAEVAESLKNHLQNSHAVKLDGIGTFKVGLRTSPAATSGEFTAANIMGYRINYQPEKHFVASAEKSEKGFRKGTFVKDLLDGITFKESPKNAVVDTKETKPAE